MYRIAIQPIRIESSLFGGVTFSSSPGYRTPKNWMDYFGAQPRAHPLVTSQTMTKLLKVSDIIWISRHRGQNHPLGIWRADPLLTKEPPESPVPPNAKESRVNFCWFIIVSTTELCLTQHVGHLVQRIPKSERTTTFLSGLEVYSCTLKHPSLLSLLHKEGKSSGMVKHDTNKMKTYLIFLCKRWWFRKMLNISQQSLSSVRRIWTSKPKLDD